MSIHLLRSDDLGRFQAIRLRALSDAPEAFGTRFEDAALWSHDAWWRLFSSLRAWVAVADGADVGMVRTAPDPRVATAARLGSLWVAPEARGIGVGAALVETAVVWARFGGFHQILLDVSDDNGPAISLYERLGFEPTGVVSAFPPPRQHLRKHQRRRVLRAPRYWRRGDVPTPPPGAREADAPFPRTHPGAPEPPPQR